MNNIRSIILFPSLAVALVLAMLAGLFHNLLLLLWLHCCKL